MEKFEKIIGYTFICFLLFIVFSSLAQAGITDVDHGLNDLLVIGHRRNNGIGSSDCGDGVFGALACRTGQFAEGLRKLAMVLSGFGIIMFTFLAICGKINFKHLGYIFICLFFLSGVGAMIVYIKGGNSELTYHFQDTIDQAVTSEGRSSSL